jgi:ComF family protein
VWLRSFLVPSRCVVCGCSGTDLCGVCSNALRRVGDVSCARCGAPTLLVVARCRECAGRRLGFAQARAAIVYDARAKRLVRAWKEQGVRRLAPHALALVLAEVPRPRADAVVPLPPDGERGLRRGRHPAQQLAALLAEAWRLPAEESLVRTPSVLRQRGLSVTERRRNVRGVFAVQEEPPRRVVLVDDVYTTGATVDAAARALRHAGSAHVEVVTLARVERLR